MAISAATKAATDALAVNRAPTGVNAQEVHRWLQSFTWDFDKNHTKYPAKCKMANIVLNDLPVDFIDEWRTHCLAEDTPELISESVDQLGAMSLADWEMHGIKMALNECEGNISLASKKLGITRTTLYKKIERFGLRKTKESVVYA